MALESIVLLFVKAPLPGRVKSRLAAVTGQVHAVNLYKNFVLDILEMLEKTGYRVRIFFYPSGAGSEVAEWLGTNREYMPQSGNDLGERMERAFAGVFSEGFSRAVLVGSDIPDLKATLVREAFLSLERSDAVLGPAADGGYYLIGFNRNSFFPRPFHGIEWSTPSVFQDTLGILRSASCRVHLLAEWEDIDSLAALKSFAERNDLPEFRSSRTMQYLGRYRDDLLACFPGNAAAVGRKSPGKNK
jgi:rSAM/selenodomain-associated transferase 1